MSELNFKEIILCYMTRVLLTLFIISGKTFRTFEGWIYFRLQMERGGGRHTLVGTLVTASLSVFKYCA